MNPLDALHLRILGCTLCQDAGYIERAAPVVAESRGRHIALIGQAPGVTELDVRRPFAGRAGRELFRWMDSIDIAEAEFRANVYVTSITKCFPGKATSGSGDRRPSAREIALCRPFLEEQLRLVRPEVILLVGGMAIERYFQKTPLDALIGRAVERDGRTYIPLPHPSGASRWLNDQAHREMLRAALAHVRTAWDLFVASDGGGSATGPRLEAARH
jgi:uracil-DNA glycosylase family 4